MYYVPKLAIREYAVQKPQYMKRAGEYLLLYDHSDTGGDWNYQGWDPDDPAGVREIK